MLLSSILLLLTALVAVLASSSSSDQSSHEITSHNNNFKRTSTMTCGASVKLCGLLTLESGYGPGTYNHPVPHVHGLWPENGSYGTSQCIAPSQSSADPTKVYSCYNQTDETDASNLSFEVHEWETHGICAGVKNSNDFFTQICTLSASPIKIMTAIKNQGGDLNEMAKALTKAGYEVYAIDTTNSQLELSACSPSSGQWTLSPIANFSQYCGF
jgi:hypothetical protein